MNTCAGIQIWMLAHEWLEARVECTLYVILGGRLGLRMCCFCSRDEAGDFSKLPLCRICLNGSSPPHLQLVPSPSPFHVTNTVLQMTNAGIWGFVSSLHLAFHSPFPAAFSLPSPWPSLFRTHPRFPGNEDLCYPRGSPHNGPVGALPIILHGCLSVCMYVCMYV